MIQSDQPEIVTLVAWPSAQNGNLGDKDKSDNTFIDAVLETLASKHLTTHRVIKVSSVRDIDVALSDILMSPKFKGKIRLQIVGHGLSGILALGALWIPDSEIPVKAYSFPYYVLDTTPASLGLLAKFAGKISQVMLVSCNIGSSTSFGHAINGRTLTYTLSELLHCLVLGADDVVGPHEFDARGRYEPAAQRRKPKGWRWLHGRPPMWVEAGIDPA